MRVLLAVPRYDYGKPQNGDSYEYQSWFRPLAGLGHDVELFDMFGPGWAFDSEATGRALLGTVKEWAPDLVLMLLMERDVSMETIDAVRRSCPVANWFADDTWRYRAFSRHVARHFSWVVTTSHAAKQQYDRMGDVRALFSPWGYDPEVYHPVDAEPVSDVGFVGQRYGRRGQIIERLRAEGFSVSTRGSGWPEGRIESSALAAQFASARINLSFMQSSAGPFQRLGIRVRGSWRADGLINRVVPPPLQMKARPFELAGCGVFQLTEVVPELLDFFEAGNEIGTFDSEQSLRRAIRYYLDHDDERCSIARAGLERAAAYAWPHVLARVFDWAAAYH